jgi:hypothetical protein
MSQQARLRVDIWTSCLWTMWITLLITNENKLSWCVHIVNILFIPEYSDILMSTLTFSLTTFTSDDIFEMWGYRHTQLKMKGCFLHARKS